MTKRTKATTWQASGYRKADHCESGECCWYGPHGPGTLEVDHIDGHRENNALDNLQTLCRCCHGIKTMRQDMGPKRDRVPAQPAVRPERTQQAPLQRLGLFGLPPGGPVVDIDIRGLWKDVSREKARRKRETWGGRYNHGESR